MRVDEVSSFSVVKGEAQALSLLVRIYVCVVGNRNCSCRDLLGRRACPVDTRVFGMQEDRLCLFRHTLKLLPLAARLPSNIHWENIDAVNVLCFHVVVQ